MVWNTRVTELLNIKYPIIQGGLAHLAYSDLAAAVSNAGGLGQITAMSLDSPGALKEEIDKTRGKTASPFGVNFAIGQHGRPFKDYVKIAIEENVPVISVTGGNPAPLFEQLEGTAIKKLVLVSSRRQAIKAEELGADAVMVVGQEGGGHLGKEDTGTMVLIPRVVDAVSIPVIASGGIADGRGMMAAFALGAEGVEMGTRFIAVKECIHANETYKQKLIDGSESDTVIIKKSLGSPGRVIANEWAGRILELERAGADFDTLRDFINGEANKRFIHEGKAEEGFAWAGQAMGLINDIPPTAVLIERIIHEASAIRRKWAKEA
ncbi:NAD(P)H-dependent flavin oxidoreductase [Bacillus sp. B-jedd]|uniref:NAD(P)H-dependent flavin oxidoreductase n=1 Tax=Bacillus sp. B-jedd TaxID=1476857 RepID=UPI00051555A8|nr:nitronate monooxygenase [Bacillus sp. B-jedd]CEG26672.1 2-nitropropane dioxygenase NPD [Bacillus sp. B-jedd]